MKVASKKRVTDLKLLAAIEKAIDKEEPFEKLAEKLGITIREFVDRVKKIREGSSPSEPIGQAYE